LVEVEDDGCGFDASRAKRSGLRGLQDRIETLGGRLELRSRPGNGTVLRMDVPTYERTSV
jgi:signal transduction histidine kinase